MIEWLRPQYPAPYPLVVVVSGRKPNPSTYIFFGQFNEHPPVVGIGIKEKRHTYRMIKETGDFSVNFVDPPMLRRADAAGLLSGRRHDKSDLFRWEPSSTINSPRIADAPLSLEVVYLEEVKFTDHILILGEVRKAWAREGATPEDFVVSSYSSMGYFSVGKKLERWGFSGGKP